MAESCPQGRVPEENENPDGGDVIEDILKDMNALAPDDIPEPEMDGAGQGIAEMFMRQLLAKELLYEPMKVYPTHSSPLHDVTGVCH